MRITKDSNNNSLMQLVIYAYNYILQKLKEKQKKKSFKSTVVPH